MRAASVWRVGYHVHMYGGRILAASGAASCLVAAVVLTLGPQASPAVLTRGPQASALHPPRESLRRVGAERKRARADGRQGSARPDRLDAELRRALIRLGATLGGTRARRDGAALSASAQEQTLAELQEDPADLTQSCAVLSSGSWLPWASQDQDSIASSCPTQQSSTYTWSKSGTTRTCHSYNALSGKLLLFVPCVALLCCLPSAVALRSRRSLPADRGRVPLCLQAGWMVPWSRGAAAGLTRARTPGGVLPLGELSLYLEFAYMEDQLEGKACTISF